jgi:hypothetical protein
MSFRPVPEAEVACFRKFISNAGPHDLPKPTERVTHAFDTAAPWLRRIGEGNARAIFELGKKAARAQMARDRRLGRDDLNGVPMTGSNDPELDGVDSDDPAARLRAVLKAEGVAESVIVAAVNALNVGGEDEENVVEPGHEKTFRGPSGHERVEALDDLDDPPPPHRLGSRAAARAGEDKPPYFRGRPNPGGHVDDQDPAHLDYTLSAYNGNARDEIAEHVSSAKMDHTSVPAGGMDEQPDFVRARNRTRPLSTRVSIPAQDTALSISPCPDWTEKRRPDYLRKAQMSLDAVPNREVRRQVRHAMDNHLDIERRQSLQGFTRRFPNIRVPKAG